MWKRKTKSIYPVLSKHRGQRKDVRIYLYIYIYVYNFKIIPDPAPLAPPPSPPLTVRGTTFPRKILEMTCSNYLLLASSFQVTSPLGEPRHSCISAPLLSAQWIWRKGKARKARRASIITHSGTGVLWKETRVGELSLISASFSTLPLNFMGKVCSLCVNNFKSAFLL